MILLLTRDVLSHNDPDAYTVLHHLSTPGHTASSSPHVKLRNLRIPHSHVLAPPTTDTAVRLVSAAFTSSAALVGAMAVGIMRAAFEAALQYSKTHDAGGSVVLLERQSVADLLIEIKMRVEAGRALVWKAAHAVERGEGGEELAYAAKIWCSEAAVKCVADAMRAVGV